MPKRASIFYLIVFSAAVLIGAVTVYYAVRAGVVNSNLFVHGLITGFILGSLTGVISVKGLQKRLNGNLIRRLHGWEFAPYIVLIFLIVFYQEFGGLFCRLFEVTAREECLSRIYGVFYGVLYASFVADLLWVVLWEYRYRKPLYFE